MVVLGFLLVTALRAAPQALGGITVGDRQEELIQVIEDLEARRDALEQNLSSLRLELASLGARSAASRGKAEDYAVLAGELGMAAGVVAVHGPGLRLTVADAAHPGDAVADIEGSIVHDYDLRALVNALWAGGAEAMAVNGERLTQFSAIRCVGSTILVNSTRVASPFTIEAIGDGELMASALLSDPESAFFVNEHARRFGLTLKIEKVGDLLLPAYSGRLAPRELRPEGSS